MLLTIFDSNSNVTFYSFNFMSNIFDSLRIDEDIF